MLKQMTLKGQRDRRKWQNC